jgi:hypothetical protein
MLDKNAITQKLTASGFQKQYVNTVTADVAQVILNKSLNAVLLKSPEEERLKFKNFSEEELVKYVQENQTTLPKISKEEFEHIYTETWESYFTAVSH